MSTDSKRKRNPVVIRLRSLTRVKYSQRATILLSWRPRSRKHSADCLGLGRVSAFHGVYSSSANAVQRRCPTWLQEGHTHPGMSAGNSRNKRGKWQHPSRWHILNGLIYGQQADFRERKRWEDIKCLQESETQRSECNTGSRTSQQWCHAFTSSPRFTFQQHQKVTQNYILKIIIHLKSIIYYNFANTFFLSMCTVKSYKLTL